MNFVALKMLTGDRAKYLGLIFAIAFCTFLLENQTGPNGQGNTQCPSGQPWGNDPHLDHEDDAQVIFETLNARGEPLLPADLLRNDIQP